MLAQTRRHKAETERMSLAHHSPRPRRTARFHGRGLDLPTWHENHCLYRPIGLFGWLKRSCNSCRSLCIPADRMTGRMNWDDPEKGKRSSVPGGECDGRSSSRKRAGGMGGAVGSASCRPPDGRRASAGVVAVQFYGRVSTEDWQDPVTSAGAAAGAGRGAGPQSRGDRGGVRRYGGVPGGGVGAAPQSAALVAQLADPDRGWDAIVVGE
jgi:hypothetical protein